VSVADVTVAPPRRSFLNRPVIRAFRHSPTGIASLAVILLMVLVAIFAPMFLSDQADEQNFEHVYENPSWEYPLGTDSLGRDIFARVLVATRLSLVLALAAAGLGLVIGVGLGGIVPLVGTRVRPVVLRFIDTMLSFPGILKAIFIGAIVGAGTGSAVLGVGFAISFSLARVTSTLAMSVGGRDYVSAAKILGVRRPRLMGRYVFPNIAEPILIAMSVAITAAIVQVSALSFLGLGVQPPSYDWGRLLIEGIDAIYVTPAAALGPAVAIALSAIAFGFFGEAVARALNPRLWTAPSKRGATPLEAGNGSDVLDAFEEQPPSFGRALLARPGDAASHEQPAARTDTPVALRVRDVTVTFPGPDGPIEILKGISFDVREGEILGILGESGSGKTMTALAIAQLVPFPGRVAGSVQLHGTELTQLSRRELDRVLGLDLAFVFQDPTSSLNPAHRIGPQMALPLRAHRRLGRRKAEELAVAALREVDIPAADRQAYRYPHEFSGGMRQRAMIAKGLMKDPSLLIADEPTTALDVTIQAQIMDLLSDVNEHRQTAVILISHNLAVVSQNCGRVIVMYAGRIVEELDSTQLVADPLHPYTHALLSAVPELGHPRDQPFASIPGEIPDISSPPSGCPFHPRCPLAIDRCRIERPALLSHPRERRRVACHVANDELTTS
jgi:peptide/nickel transport system permease protein